MGKNSKIEWTDHTFNPWVGCLKVSPGCKNCYAERDMTRKGRWANTWGPAQTTERLRTSDENWKKPLRWNSQPWQTCPGCGWRGPESDLLPQPMPNYPLACPVCCRGDKLIPTRQRVFCASLSDVFEDNDALIDWRLDLFRLIGQTPHLNWLILTKRPEFAGLFFRLRSDLLYPNIWLGVSVENQEQANRRIPELLEIPAAIRFLSCEPLLGTIDLSGRTVQGVWIDPDYASQDPGLQEIVDNEGWPIHWVIVGGESGHDARPMHPEWARSLRDQCQAAGVAFNFKQWGEFVAKPQIATLRETGWEVNWRWLDTIRGKEWGCLDINGKYLEETTTWNGRQNDPRDDYEVTVYKVGKHAAGRLLDGREWNQFPEPSPVPA